MIQPGAIVINEQQLRNKASLESTWESIIQNLPNERLKTEAKNKGFKIVDNPYIEDDQLARYMLVEIPNASPELEEYMKDNMLKYVICLK